MSGSTKHAVPDKKNHIDLEYTVLLNTKLQFDTFFNNIKRLGETNLTSSVNDKYYSPFSYPWYPNFVNIASLHL